MTQYISKEKLEELKEKLQKLQTTERFAVAEKLKKAKEHGDLSENFEYAQAKDDQEALEREILELGQLIRDASIITKSRSKNEVAVGHTVVLKDKKGNKMEYMIVGAQDADPTNARISNTSPIGRALLGKKVGEKAVAQTPRGALELTVLKIQ